MVLAIKLGGVELHFHFLNFASTPLDVEGGAGLWALLQAGSVTDDRNRSKLPKLPLSWPVTTEGHPAWFRSGQRYPEAVVLREI